MTDKTCAILLNSSKLLIMDTGVSKQAAPLISRHMKDLLRRPIGAVRECLEDPNTPRDYAKRQHSKGLAARAVAARYILKAIEGSAAHGDTLLDRTEGKVGGNEGSGGNTINFIFNNLGGQAAIPGSAGEVIQGVLASQAVNPLPVTHTPLTVPVKNSVQRALPANTLDNGSSEDEYMPGAD